MGPGLGRKTALDTTSGREEASSSLTPSCSSATRPLLSLSLSSASQGQRSPPRHRTGLGCPDALELRFGPRAQVCVLPSHLLGRVPGLLSWGRKPWWSSEPSCCRSKKGATPPTGQRAEGRGRGLRMEGKGQRAEGGGQRVRVECGGQRMKKAEVHLGARG